MANSVPSAAHFQNEDAAFDYVESHLWPRGPICPHCGEREKIGRLQGKTTRPGLRKCYACRKPFTVRIGTIFEDSHLALHLWLQVIHLMCASKKGISTRQVQRMLQCSMKTAWHLTHRIRLAMADNPGELGPLGGKGKVVEADETYFGSLPPEKAPIRKNPDRPKSGPGHKRAIVSLVERGKESRLHTDESRLYWKIGYEMVRHEAVNHSKKEYVRGDVTTNTIESFFSVFKRGMRGVYQQSDERHLHRYLAEFDFQYNAREALGVSDQQRASRAVMGGKGKRLTYETIA